MAKDKNNQEDLENVNQPKNDDLESSLIVEDEAQENNSAEVSSDKEQVKIDRMQEEAEAAADFLEGILDEAMLPGDIQMGISNNRVLLEVIADSNSKTARTLVGRDNRTLDALQTLTREVVQKNTGNRSKLILDIAEARKLQEESLRRKTSNAIKTVIKNESIYRFKPMNSYQRKMVHAMAKEAGVFTVSKGMPPNRYVVLSKYEIVSND